MAHESTDGSVSKNALVSHDSSMSNNSLETDSIPAQHRQRSAPEHTVNMPDVPYNEVCQAVSLSLRSPKQAHLSGAKIAPKMSQVVTYAKVPKEKSAGSLRRILHSSSFTSQSVLCLSRI